MLYYVLVIHEKNISGGAIHVHVYHKCKCFLVQLLTRDVYGKCLSTLGAHVQEGYVVVSVSVKSHLTSLYENTITCSAGNGGQNIFGFSSETDLLQRSSIPSVESHTCM